MSDVKNEKINEKATPVKSNKTTRTIGIVIGIILCVVSIPVIIFNLIIIIQGLANPNQVPSFGNSAPLVVLSDSMYPTIQGGDLIFVDKTDPSSIKNDDVISFFDPAAENSTAVLTHRVIETTTENGQISWRTKGDTNTGIDKKLAPASKFVGKYNGVRFAGIGNFCMWLKSVPGMIVCIGIPLILLVGYDILRRRLYSSRQRKTEEELRAEIEDLKNRTNVNHA